MRTTQLEFDQPRGWSFPIDTEADLPDAQLVIVTGARQALGSPDLLPPLRERFPGASVVLCSSGADIAGDRVRDVGAVATAVQFAAARVRALQEDIRGREDSEAAGARLAARLPPSDLRHVLVFSEGLQVNGSALATGLAKALPPSVSVTGGLAGDGERFGQTVVGLDGPPAAGRVVVVGLYGHGLRIGMGSLGGWETFGSWWTVTRSDGNVVHELDGEPALTLYKRAIGAHAYALPSSGLLYPLHLEDAGDATNPQNPGIVRTLLAVDDRERTLTFAGAVPQGRRVRLMRATLDRLIDASSTAARGTLAGLRGSSPELVLLVSCIGRKLLLQRRVEEELQSARRVFGRQARFAGFYSYGELSPLTPSARCELHNQTMTITALAEA